MGRNGWCRCKEGSVHVPNCKSLLVTEAERNHVRRRARFQQHRDTSFHLYPLPLHGKASKEIHAIHRQNWVAQFKRGDFSTCFAPRPGRPKTVTTPEIIDQIHELFLEERRISAKSIAVKLWHLT